MSGCSVDFPIYDITSIDSVRVALCGGGGAVKSGVPNAVVSFISLGMYFLSPHLVSYGLDKCGLTF